MNQPDGNIIIRILKHGTIGYKIIPVNNENFEGIILELEPPERIHKNIFLVKIKIELWKIANGKQFQVGSITHFEVNITDDNILLDANHKFTITQIAHLVKTVCDQTRVYYQSMVLSVGNPDFKDTIIDTYYPFEYLYNKVKIALHASKN